MSESALWMTVRRHVAPYGHVVRHENRAGPGTPDVSYTIRGRSGWIELKYLDAPARGGVSIPHLTLEQVRWATTEAAAGGRAWMLLQVGHAYFLCLPGIMADIHAGGVTMAGLRERASAQGVTKFPTVDIVKQLMR